jgi:hypothetical protein
VDRFTKLAVRGRGLVGLAAGSDPRAKWTSARKKLGPTIEATSQGRIDSSIFACRKIGGADGTRADIDRALLIWLGPIYRGGFHKMMDRIDTTAEKNGERAFGA